MWTLSRKEIKKKKQQRRCYIYILCCKGFICTKKPYKHTFGLRTVLGIDRWNHHWLGCKYLHKGRDWKHTGWHLHHSEFPWIMEHTCSSNLKSNTFFLKGAHDFIGFKTKSALSTCLFRERTEIEIFYWKMKKSLMKMFSGMWLKINCHLSLRNHVWHNVFRNFKALKVGIQRTDLSVDWHWRLIPFTVWWVLPTSYSKEMSV